LDYLERRGYRPREVAYTRFAGNLDEMSLAFYQSGKLVVQGKGTKEFVEFVLEPEILGVAELGYEAVLNPELLLPRIGIDESGKGDFFGPLCVAGAYVNEEIVRRWTEAGVQDSKKIKSSRRIRELGRMIRETKGVVVEKVVIGNEAYNRLYAKMRNVNSMLAWGHARVLENLMGKVERMIPRPVRAISDQFARSKATLEKALMNLSRELEFVQRHKAEEDMAVAAASIIAREAFLDGMEQLGKRCGQELPRGGGAEVNAAIEALVKRSGAEVLASLGKLHFRNTLKYREL